MWCFIVFKDQNIKFWKNCLHDSKAEEKIYRTRLVTIFVYIFIAQARVRNILIHRSRAL